MAHQLEDDIERLILHALRKNSVYTDLIAMDPTTGALTLAPGNDLGFADSLILFGRFPVPHIGILVRLFGRE